MGNHSAWNGRSGFRPSSVTDTRITLDKSQKLPVLLSPVNWEYPEYRHSAELMYCSQRCSMRASSMLKQNWPPLFPSRVVCEHRMLSQSLVWRLWLCKGQDNVSEAILHSIPSPLAFFSPITFSYAQTPWLIHWGAPRRVSFKGSITYPHLQLGWQENCFELIGSKTTKYQIWIQSGS